MPNTQVNPKDVAKVGQAINTAKDALAQAETIFALLNGVGADDLPKAETVPAADDRRVTYGRRATDNEPHSNVRTSKGSKGSKANQTESKNGQSSAGRQPSPEQVEVREMIQKAIDSGELQLFTIKGLTTQLGKDRIQVRNAVNYFEAQKLIERFAEKLGDGTRGNRELIYKPVTVQSEVVG